MTCRDLQSADLPRLQELFAAQGFEYEFPDLQSAQFIVKRVLVDDNGVILGAIAARQTVELFLLADPTWQTPRWRLEALRLQHEDMRQQLAVRGIRDAHAWLPPQICRAFGRRLLKSFGWRKQMWDCYSRDTGRVA